MDPSKRTATGTGAKLGLGVDTGKSDAASVQEGTKAAVELAKKNAPTHKARHDDFSDDSGDYNDDGFESP